MSKKESIFMDLVREESRRVARDRVAPADIDSFESGWDHGYGYAQVENAYAEDQKEEEEDDEYWEHKDRVFFSVIRNLFVFFLAVISVASFISIIQSVGAWEADRWDFRFVPVSDIPPHTPVHLVPVSEDSVHEVPVHEVSPHAVVE